jgi:CheY-like chemotaxis protein
VSVRRILIVEDEETLRIGMMRALAKLPQVEVMGAGTVHDALALIDGAPPDAVISDLDLPDRFGAEILGELDRRGLRIPVTFVSAFTRSLGEKVPRSPRVRMVDKPISLERLRELATQALAGRRDSELPPPFGPSDYLQLACLGRHSVVITHRADERDEHALGRIVVWRGQLWTAQDAGGEGEDAFRRIVTTSGAFRCHTLDRDPGPQQIHGSWEMLLLDALRLLDEQNAAPFGDASSGELASSPAPPIFETESIAPPPGHDRWGAEAEAAPRSAAADDAARYEEAFERGVGALLGRDYASATRSFQDALRARPGDALATANLERLRALGHVHDGDGSGGGS